MKKLKKNFNSNGFSVESMSARAGCNCSCWVGCHCITVYDYAAYQGAPTWNYANVYNDNVGAIA